MSEPPVGDETPSPVNPDFMRWEVKPIWKISYPSTLTGSNPTSFQIYGVDRGSMDITRNWDKIHSVEQFNQGFVAKPTDFTITIAVKEQGETFEKLRRLAKGGILFDVECDLLRDASGIPVGDRSYDRLIEQGETFTPWLQGFEQFLGCVVNREGQTIEQATFPVREFEITFLRHAIKEITTGDFAASKLMEGDGSYPGLDELNI